MLSTLFGRVFPFRLLLRGEQVGPAQNEQETSGDKVTDQDEIQLGVSLEEIHPEQSNTPEPKPSSIIPHVVPENYGDQATDQDEIQPNVSLEPIHADQSTAAAKPSSIIPPLVPDNSGVQAADLNEIQENLSLEQIHAEKSTAEAVNSTSGDGNIEKKCQKFEWEEENARPLEPWHQALLEKLCKKPLRCGHFCDKLQNHAGKCTRLCTYPVDVQLQCGHTTLFYCGRRQALIKANLPCRSRCDGVLPNNKSCRLPCHFGKSCEEMQL